MRLTASLILVLALAAAGVASAEAAGGGPILLAQAAPTEEETAPPETDGTPTAEDDEARPPEEAEAAEESPGEPGPEATVAPDQTPQQPPAEQAGAEAAEDGAILRSEEAMPEPVRETWRALVAAARSGDIERLRPIMEEQAEPPMVAFDHVGDPIAYLRSLSGDPEGREILAILLEILEAGFLHVDEQTPQEMYLWPYFARQPIDELTPPQMVELFTLLTAGDYQDMLSYGAYIFFRVGIAPDGRWLFFLAGD